MNSGLFYSITKFIDWLLTYEKSDLIFVYMFGRFSIQSSHVQANPSTSQTEVVTIALCSTFIWRPEFCPLLIWLSIVNISPGNSKRSPSFYTHMYKSTMSLYILIWKVQSLSSFSLISSSSLTIGICHHLNLNIIVNAHVSSRWNDFRKVKQPQMKEKKVKIG